MKRLKLWLLACSAILAMGCGGEPAEALNRGEELSTSSEELTICTATCDQGTVSCPATTTTCSATHYVGVRCDGVAIDCPPPPPPTCATLPTCESIRNQLCESPGTQTECCWGGVAESSCFCHPTRVRYTCSP